MMFSMMGSWLGRARQSVLVVAAAGALVSGCASRDQDVWDPIELPNRFIFSINQAVDVIALRPLAVAYRDLVPEPAQRGINNALHNLGEPVTAINEVLQGDPGRALTTLARFIVNSTIGIGGLFDVASAMGLSKTKEDMGKTIGMWAAAPPEDGGPYLVLPGMGPSNARDAAGMVFDNAVDPFNILAYALNWDRLLVLGPRNAARAVDARSRTLVALDDIEKNSVDFYAAVRSAYTQQRGELIRRKREKTDTRGELERREDLALVR
ncbi:MAG: VacJ family lipoprotein [Alphaproteobacteria bacterium]|nr:VacJ family lipoprotein [Alphaproteobacteria bacterium]